MMGILTKFLYNLSISSYVTGIRIAALFNKKAAQWVHGRKNWDQQLRNAIPPEGVDLWIHCASLGEFEQGRPIIEGLRKEHPNLFILLSFFSPSGYEIRKDYAEVDAVCYLPSDTAKNALTFLSIVQPRLTIFVKYEFWYHFIARLQKQQRPIILISGIFRENQLFFKSYGAFFRNLLKGYEHLFVQDQTSAALLKKAEIPHFSIAGDTRFDRVAQLAGQTKSFPEIEHFIDGKYCWVAGSSWPPDERILKTIFLKIPKWIIAPHEIHEKHLKEIENLFDGTAIRYSALLKDPKSGVSSRVLIIDNIGMLASVYQLSEVAYIGGGFGQGIHNILEAAVHYIPVIFGPNYQKFEEANALLAREGAFTIKDEKELKQLVAQFASSSFRKKTGEKAGHYVHESLGATKKILNYIQEKRFLIKA